MDTKILMVERFKPKMSLFYVDQLTGHLNSIIRKAQNIDGILICNTNPFLIAVNILTLLNWIKYQYPIL